jgi:adenylate cyclase
MNVFLQETEGTVLVFDMRGFSSLAATLAPLDLGLALNHFYAHCESCVLAHDGRVVKFAGDAVLAVWLAHQLPDHRSLGMAAVAKAYRERDAWLDDNRNHGMPPLDFSVAAASGPLLAGHIGTERMKTFDVIGEPVNIAVKLTTIATARSVQHLVSFQVPQHPTIETEAIELGGKTIRLFRLA